MDLMTGRKQEKSERPRVHLDPGSAQWWIVLVSGALIANLTT